MDTSTSESLMKLLQELGIYQAVGWAILVAAPTVVAVAKGIHTLVSGWHTRRREFSEMYEKLWIDNPDPLAIETAVRHGFGEWLPAKTIQRIRTLPCPSQRLLALNGVVRFLDMSEKDGAIAINPKFASTAKRTGKTALYFFGYFACGMLFALSIGVHDEFAHKLTLSSRVMIGILSFGYGFHCINTAMDLQKLSRVAGRYPDLFGLELNAAHSNEQSTLTQARKSLADAAIRFASWARRAHVKGEKSKDQSAPPSAEMRSSRSASAASTPRA